VTPATPAIGSSVDMELDMGETVFQSPILRIHFDTGTQEVNMLGTTPGDFFTYNIASLTSLISSIDLVNPETGAIEHTWWPGTYGGGPTGCDIILSNDPPVIGLALNVQVDFPNYLPFTPQLFVDFENDAPKTYYFPQGAGFNTYTREVPIGDMTSQVILIEVWDDYNNMMCERGFTAGGVSVQTLTVDPDPPVIGQDLQVHVEFNVPNMLTSCVPVSK